MNSPIGNILIEEIDEKIIKIGFTEIDETHETLSPLLSNTANQLSEYFKGTRQVFDVPLDPQGTDFQKEVWNYLMEIPYGTTISYQTLANKLGNSKVIRAAASANGKNPIAIIIPCHRVIGSNGKMTGYAGGIERKKQLLKVENAPVMNQIRLF